MHIRGVSGGLAGFAKFSFQDFLSLHYCLLIADSSPVFHSDLSLSDGRGLGGWVGGCGGPPSTPARLRDRACDLLSRPRFAYDGAFSRAASGFSHTPHLSVPPHPPPNPPSTPTMPLFERVNEQAQSKVFTVKERSMERDGNVAGMRRAAN